MKTRKMELGEITRVIDPIVAMRSNDWFLVSATDAAGKTNALTAAWGGFGNVCNKPTATIYIRPQRFTKRFIDESGRFTMTFFDFARYKGALAYLGSHSGADDPDKIRHAGLTLAALDGQPTYEEGRYAILCKPFFSQQLAPEHFLDLRVAQEMYPDRDYSYLYLAEIEAAYEILR
jgi:flavin reductase (DIM6/NTAB) family NADH-FMN oxidoreductase RutF